MKNSVKSIVSKFSLTALALLIMQNVASASEKVPEVYVSMAPVSDLSGQQLLNTAWFWMLIAAVAAVAITAFFATSEAENTDEAHIL